MDIEKLKKLNSSPVPEATTNLILTGLESKIKELLAEQIIMNSQAIADKADLTTRLEENEKNRSLQLKQVNALVVTLNKKLEELQQQNYQKLERASEIIQQEAKMSHETNSKIIREVMELVRLVEFIPKPNWKERSKQYGTQLLITVGLATVILGAFRLVTILVSLLKH